MNSQMQRANTSKKVKPYSNKRSFKSETIYLAAKPTQTVETFGLMCFIVSKMAMPGRMA